MKRTKGVMHLFTLSKEAADAMNTFKAMGIAKGGLIEMIARKDRKPSGLELSENTPLRISLGAEVAAFVGNNAAKYGMNKQDYLSSIVEGFCLGKDDTGITEAQAFKDLITGFFE